MKQLALVIVTSIVMVVAVVLHKNAIAALLGVIIGTPFFLYGFSKGGGIAEARITGGGKKTDPTASIGLGLAASGIGASIMTNEHYPQSFRLFYTACFAAGLVIAIGFAGKTFLKERRGEPMDVPPSSDQPS